MLQFAARRVFARRAHLLPLRRLTTAPGPQREGVLNELVLRGLIADVTRPEKLEQHLEQGKRTIYAGIDPTAPALHVGHLIPLMVLLHFQMRGHHIISLIGGATALVGDPSGRTEERVAADPSLTESNMRRLTKHVTFILQNALSYAKTRQTLTKDVIRPAAVKNNRDWLQNIGLLEFLQTVGPQKGLSFTEFTYQLLQAYDFLWLFKNRECTIQVGGSDQWGNILAGLELINREQNQQLVASGDSRLPPEEGFGLTTPLLTTPSGQKFGKSAGNAVWLDENMTSVFDFYQFFLRTADADVERQLLSFTFLPKTAVENVMLEQLESPELRKAQTLLADEVTTMVHGEIGSDGSAELGLQRARTITKIIFGSDYRSLKASEIVTAFANDPRLRVVSEHDMHNKTVGELAVIHELIHSKSEATRLATSKGFYMNNKTMGKIHEKIQPTDLIDDRVAILRAGKSKHLILVLDK
ncbi:hypothetical protein HWV62_31391 [Athelia sp. TMB]|nr:hypothetical protein HWV62_31391 [Athelia sp. TMB]